MNEPRFLTVDTMLLNDGEALIFNADAHLIEGAPLTGGNDADPATTTELGEVSLSVAPVDEANPIVVGDNDPRNSDAREPLPHQHVATEVTGLGDAATKNVGSAANQVAAGNHGHSDLPAPLRLSNILRSQANGQVGGIEVVDLASDGRQRIQPYGPYGTPGYIEFWDISGITIVNANYHGNAHIASPYLASSNNGAGDVRIAVGRSGTGAGQSLYMVAEMYAMAGTQPDWHMVANGFQFGRSSDGLRTFVMDTAGNWKFVRRVRLGNDEVFTNSTPIDDSYYALYFDTSTGDIVQSLPDATGQDGRELVFFKTTNDANRVTVAPLEGQGATCVLPLQDSCVTYRAFSGRWRRIAAIDTAYEAMPVGGGDVGETGG